MKPAQEWRVTENGNLICSEDFTFDAMLKLDGDFADDAQRIQYAEAIASKLNSALESVRSEALQQKVFEKWWNDQEAFVLSFACKGTAWNAWQAALQSTAIEAVHSTELRK